MGLVFSATFGLILWVVLWSIGVKAMDSFMLTILIVLVATGTRMLLPHLPGNQRD
jgi:hypothetical protein